MSRLFSTAIAATLLVAFPLCAEEVRTLAGKVYSGTVTKIDNIEVTVTVDKEEKVPLAQVLNVYFRPVKALPADAKYSLVRLLDDTVLQCKEVAFEGKNIKITMTSGASFTLPVDCVVSFLKDAGSKKIRAQFDEFGGKGTGARRDRIFTLSKEGDLNPLNGTLGEVNDKDQTISFKWEVGDKLIPVKLEKLQGMVFYRSELPNFNPICKVMDIDGNTLAATKLAYDGKTLDLTTGYGVKIPVNAASLASLDFNLGKLTYLSDMQPAKVVEKSGIGLITRYQKDANLDGEPILLDKQHAKGLSIHSHTELEYNLAGKFKEFKAVLGADVRTGSDSKAIVTIYCDGQKTYTQTVNVAATQPVNLNVNGVNTLRIVVSSQNFLDLHDHATLADARVSQ